jgi:hypothetical protein
LSKDPFVLQVKLTAFSSASHGIVPGTSVSSARVYKGKKFSARDVEEIKKDIDAIRRVCDLLQTASWEVGLVGEIGKETIERLIRNHSEVYGDYPVNVTEEQTLALHSLVHIARWMTYGAERVFLQDANAIIMRTHELSDVLKYLKEKFPNRFTDEEFTGYNLKAEDLKDIFENSPLKTKIAGVPLLSVLGVATLVLYIYIAYAALINPSLGNVSPAALSTTFGLAISALIIFYLVKAIRKSQGIDMDAVFREIPPE